MTVSEVIEMARRRLLEEHEGGRLSPDDMEEFLDTALNAFVLPDLFLVSGFSMLGSFVESISDGSMTESGDHYYYTITFGSGSEIIPGTIRGKVTVDSTEYDMAFIEYDELYKYKDYSLAYFRPGKLCTVIGDEIRAYEIDSGETVTMDVDYVKSYIYTANDLGLPYMVYSKLLVPKICHIACSRMPEYHAEEEKTFEEKYQNGLRMLAGLYERRNHPEEVNIVKYQEGGEDR